MLISNHNQGSVWHIKCAFCSTLLAFRVMGWNEKTCNKRGNAHI